MQGATTWQPAYPDCKTSVDGAVRQREIRSHISKSDPLKTGSLGIRWAARVVAVAT